jgi:DNA-binding NtrC family response regulator
MRWDPRRQPESTLASTARAIHDRQDGERSKQLLVIADESFTSHAIPSAGTVSIGRSERCDVRIDHPSISRRHALLRLGPVISIEDAGSVNGTRVRDRLAPCGEAVPLSPGEVVELGDIMIIVQERSVPLRPRRLWAHGYFEARVEEECLRTERSSAEFALLYVQCTGDDTAMHTRALADVLRPSDIIGSYAPGAYEVLLADASPAVADRLRERLAARQQLCSTEARIGLACFPRDGRDPESLLSAARAAVRAPGAAPAAIDERGLDGPMSQLGRLVERIAGSNISVLVLGETGVGKEVMAERIHRLSPRRDRQFLRLNCAALSESLLESELFGHEKGAFTGATQAKIGLLESAPGGTVFLDEVGELPTAMQVKLLRVIEERRVLPVGALKTRPIDVRFVAATNRDLEEEIARGRFREDLYYRLNGVSLVIPPLRQRVDEILGLAAEFTRRAARDNGRSAPPGISAEAQQLLRAYSWPGNIRELRNVVERAVLLCGDGRWILAEHLPAETMRATFSPAPAADLPAPPEPPRPPEVDVAFSKVEQLRQAVADEERARIVEALAACAGNQTKAAGRLGIARRTLVKKLARLNIPRPRRG